MALKIHFNKKSFRQYFFLSFCLILLFNNSWVWADEVSQYQKTEKADSSLDLELNPISLTNNENKQDQAQFEGDQVDFNQATNIVTITGNAILYLLKDDIKLAADKIEYYSDKELLKAYGNVLLTGKDQVTFSKYMEIKVNNNEAFFEEVKSQLASASIEAKTGTITSTKTINSANYQNGEFDLPAPIRLVANPATVETFRFNKALQADSKTSLINGPSFSISTNRVNYYPDRIQNNLFLSGTKLKFKKFPLTLPFPYGVFTAGESTQQMFGMVLGNTPRTGAGDFNIGPKLSFVLGDPAKTRAFSLAPFVQTGSRSGYGGMVQYTDPRNNALLAYGSAKARGLAEVSSRLTAHNNFIYGWNSYMGGGITKQLIQLNDQRSVKIPYIGTALEGNSIYSLVDLSYITDSQNLRDEENNLISRLQRDSLGGNSNTKDKSGLRFQQTLALRTKPLIEVGSEKYNIGLAVVASSTARAYTTGDFNAFVNGGPRLRTHLNRFADIELGYDFLAPTGASPFGFDQVIQGQQSVSANADFNFSSWFSLGGSSVYSLTLKEQVAQQVRVTIGPEDFKILLGYDPVFKRFNFGFTLLFDDKIKFNQFTYRERKVGKKRRF